MVKKIVTKYGITYEQEKIPLNKGYELIEIFKGKQLKEYTFHPCGREPQLIPYLLADDRVVVIFEPVEAHVYSSMKGYMTRLIGRFQAIKHIPMQYPIRKIEYLPKSDKIYYFQLGKPEGEVIRTLCLRIDEINNFHSTQSEFYRTDQLEIMEYNSDYEHYNLYQCETDFIKIMQKREIASTLNKPNPRGTKPEFGYTNINMCGRNPYGENFPDYVNELAERLPNLLKVSKVNEEIFNYQQFSLSSIDRYLYRNIITDDFCDQIFLPLLAYIGKIHINAHDSNWVMKYDKYFESWSPDLAHKEDKPLQIYNPLLKILDSTKTDWYPLLTVLAI